MKLENKRCVPCEGGISPLKPKEIKEYLKHVHADWKKEGNTKISRIFYFVNYAHTMKFVNQVAVLAEEEGHHPDMHVYYGSVKIDLWTHAIDGLSENDFILAKKIDLI